jgi:hypothetical protein
MNLLHDIAHFGIKLAAAGARGDFEVQLPKAAIDLIKADASALRRFDCAPNAEGVLAMWGPAGVIVIRERLPSLMATMQRRG